MSLSQPPSFSIYIRVSELSHYTLCPKRSRLEVYGPREKYGEFSSKYVQKGNEMHKAYSTPYKSFDRQLLRYQLGQKYGKVFQRQVDNIILRGVYDDLRVLYNPRTGQKVVSVVEVKTTSRKMTSRKMSTLEIESAEFQLRLYLWILKPLIEGLGWKMHTRHYVETYSQFDGKLIKRYLVREDPEMEETIRYIIRSWKGLEKVRIPHKSVCHMCPKRIKERCDWIGRYN